ncbi:unnamed protein product [Onchocerca flexuosa]|uniref:Transthyretin-like family protein n=1 Tax=Onchocerca flexuosa TaxID=387005 RepID=A0A183HWX4_9BILA|nr:unnamed protein product [Onchocerca flexuosa]
MRKKILFYSSLKITTKEKNYFSATDIDDLLQEGRTNAQGYFELSGYTSEITTIDPFLKIYHDCDDGFKERLRYSNLTNLREIKYFKNLTTSFKFQPCQRKVAFEIPTSYVSNGRQVEKFFNIGTVNMEIKFPGETRDCIHRS